METPRDTSIPSSTATSTVAINLENDRESTSRGLPVDTCRMHDDDGPVAQASNDKDDQLLKRNYDQKYSAVNNDTDGDDNNNLLAVSAKQLQESKNEDNTMAPPILHRHSNVLQRIMTPGAHPSDHQQQSLQQQLQLPPSSPLDTDADNLPVLEATLVTNTEQELPAPVLLVANVSDEVILAEVIPHHNNHKNNDEERKKHRRRSRYLYILVAVFAFCITVVSCVLITLRLQENDQPTPLGHQFGCEDDHEDSVTPCDSGNMTTSCDHGNRCSNFTGN